MDVSIVIPCYRSPKALRNLVDDLLETFGQTGAEFEVLLVLDYRDVSTLELTSQINDRSERVRRILLSRNFGQQAATAAGIVESQGKIVVTMDDDYQQTPADALNIVNILETERFVDLVYGVPDQNHQSFGRKVSGNFFRNVMKSAGIPFFHLFSPLRGFRGYFREAIQSYGGPTVAVDVALAWVVSEVRGYVANFRPRVDGESGYSGLARFRLALSFLLAQSTAALQLGIYLGLVGVLSAMVLAGRILYLSLTDALFVPGFATTILVILFVGSIQLLLLGIIGRYVGLQHKRSIGQPAYFVAGRD